MLKNPAKNTLYILLLLLQSYFTGGFVPLTFTRTVVAGPATTKSEGASPTRQLLQFQTRKDVVSDFSEKSILPSSQDDNEVSFSVSHASGGLDVSDILATSMLVWCLTATPAQAISSSGVISGSLYAYGHFFSMMAISGCLAAERVLVKAGMSAEDEKLVVRLDLMYGLMAALLIGSGVARAYANGDFYIHEVLFWVKMSVSGIWGGLSIFPSLTFYRRNVARQNDETVPLSPVSDRLASRLHQIINAELTAILTIPILATLMSRGVSYQSDLPWQLGLFTAVACTCGAFLVYGKQALDWDDS